MYKPTARPAPQIKGFACVDNGCDLAAPGAVSVPTGEFGPQGQLFRCAPGHGCQDRDQIAEQAAQDRALADIAAAKAEQFHPGDRMRDRRTGEIVTFSRAQIVAFIDGLADEFVYDPADLEPLDGIDEQCARALARIAAVVARSGRSEASLAESIGMTAREFRDALAGRREFLVRQVLLLERVAGVPLGSLFDDEPGIEWPIRCDRCETLCAVSAYPPPPMTVYCPPCSRKA